MTFDVSVKPPQPATGLLCLAHYGTCTPTLKQTDMTGLDTVADPGFPGGANSGEGAGANLLIAIIFGENCMKMKNNGLGRILRGPSRSATEQ